MSEGDVILTPVTQADGQVKNRPGVILRELPPFGDFLIRGISTQLHQRARSFDDIIVSQDADFAGSGLRKDSLIRLGFLAVVPVRQIAGSIGTISPERHKRLLKTLADYLTEPATDNSN